MADWKKKVFIQRVLSHIPYGEEASDLLQAMKRSSLVSGMGVEGAVLDRLPLVGPLIQMISTHLPLEGAAVVEVGTGWIPVPTLLLYLAGASSIRTYDIVRRTRWGAARRMVLTLQADPAKCAEAIGVPVEQVAWRLDRIAGARNLEDLLKKANITYIAPGDAAATGLPAGSVDLYFAYSVYENIPLPVLRGFCQEARRVLRPGAGHFCAELGCADTFSTFDKRLHPLDYLQYSDEQWDRLVTRHNMYYFNRVREQEFLDLLAASGAQIETVVHRTPPGYVEYVQKLHVSGRFRRFTAEQNAIVKTEVIASYA